MTTTMCIAYLTQLLNEQSNDPNSYYDLYSCIAGDIIGVEVTHHHVGEEQKEAQVKYLQDKN